MSKMTFSLLNSKLSVFSYCHLGNPCLNCGFNGCKLKIHKLYSMAYNDKLPVLFSILPSIQQQEQERNLELIKLVLL